MHHNFFAPELACLACIYPEEPSENAHWQHVADTLNLPLERVKSGELINVKDAANIMSMYPDLAEAAVLGRAFDSVFREALLRWNSAGIRCGGACAVLLHLGTRRRHALLRICEVTTP